MERFREIKKTHEEAWAVLKSDIFQLNGVIGDLKRVDFLLKSSDVGRLYDVNEKRIREAVTVLEKVADLLEEICRSVIYWDNKYSRDFGEWIKKK